MTMGENGEADGTAGSLTLLLRKSTWQEDSADEDGRMDVMYNDFVCDRT